MKEDLKTTLIRLRADVVAFDSYFQFHRPEYAGTSAWLTLHLQVQVNDLLRALEKDGDERIARLAYDIGVLAGELKRLRVHREVDVGTKVAAGKPSSEEARRQNYEQAIKARDRDIEDFIIDLLKRGRAPEAIVDSLVDEFGYEKDQKPEKDVIKKERLIERENLRKRVSSIRKKWLKNKSEKIRATP